MNLRTVVTENSVWVFNLDTMMYVRRPVAESASHVTQIPYSDDWEPFEALEACSGPEYAGERVLVHRPVPWGTGARRQTGVIVSDTHPGSSWPDEC